MTAHSYNDACSPDDTTNIVAGNSRQPITLGQDAGHGQSGRKWESWEGTYFAGMSKCMSAQWGHDEGYDVAAVSYACIVRRDPFPPRALARLDAFADPVPWRRPSHSLTGR